MKVRTPLTFLIFLFILPMSVFVVMTTVVAVCGEVNLPRTGQTTVYAPGDDGDFQAGIEWPSPRFTDNSDGTITDNLTGLVWLQSANRFGLRTWFEAISDCNGLGADGVNLTDGSVAGDWRLPNVVELETLSNAEESSQAQWFNDQGFSDVQGPYWSSTTYVGWTDPWPDNLDFAWIVGGYSVTYDEKQYIEYISPNYHVWPVRDGQSGPGPAQTWQTGQTAVHEPGDDGDIQAGVAWPEPRFIDNADGTITDVLTGLVWLKNADCFGDRSWPDALSDCNTLASGSCGLTEGFVAGDWRLPNRKEFISLIDFRRMDPALPQDHPFTNVTGWDYRWSATTLGGYSTQAYRMRLHSGQVTNTSKSDNTYKVWPVRTWLAGSFCVDNDEDGYGVCPDCSIANGCTYNGDDCNDGDDTINPGAEITCNGVDENCNGMADDAPDSDTDTYDLCNPADPGDTDGLTADCNDGDSSINPGATESVCDGIDQDCSGADDCSCTDTDGDGYGVCPDCGVAHGCTYDGDDCNDGDDTINPGATEITCDGIDQDCSGADDCSCTDTDGDGYGAPGDDTCPNGPETDCDDGDDTINPGATDVYCDGADQDCSGADSCLTIIGTAQFGGTGPEYNLIWDDYNNGNSVVWLDYTNTTYSNESWQYQVDWAAGLDSSLTYNIDSAYTVDWGINSWRLPTTVLGVSGWGCDGTTTAGYNIISSEMGHLYYTELGNIGMSDILCNHQSGYGLQNAGPFNNLDGLWYWSGTESGVNSAWMFCLNVGSQDAHGKITTTPERYCYGLAVRSAEVAITCVDNDKDGYGVCPDCGVVNGCTYDGDDCNDGDDSIYPGATEVPCDGTDQDCSGADDCSCSDTDGDGTDDCNDNCPNDPNKTEPGVCGCGVADTDSDGDETPDCIDAFPGDPNEWLDTDGDGIGNNADPDDDNDDLPDAWELSYGLDPLDATAGNGKDGDPDNDGWTNYQEYLNGTDPNYVPHIAAHIASYGVNRPVTGYPVGSCAHCHDTFDNSICGVNPLMLFAPVNPQSQTENFCFECHKEVGTLQDPVFYNYNYSYRASGDTSITCPTNVLEAFSFIDETGSSVSNCGSIYGTSHKLTDIKNFINGRWGYTADSNPCTACHNPHPAQRDLHTASSRGWLVSLPSGHTAMSTWQLWGDDSGERMDQYTIYQAPNAVSGYEPDGSATADGSNLTDYVTFCADCHNDSNTVYSSALGRDLYAFDWNIEKHGLGDASDDYDSMTELKGPYQDDTRYVLACTDCHEPHGAPNIFLTRGKVNNGDVTVLTGTGYGPDGRANKEWVYLCGKCHDGLLKDGIHTHPWIDLDGDEQADCTACHIGGGTYYACGKCHYHGNSSIDGVDYGEPLF